MSIRHLLFDLDNTLYPSSSAIDAGITRRMMEFVASFLALPMDAAADLRKKRMPLYGTTLEWLRIEHKLTDVEEYFSYVHPVTEASELTPDKKLRPFLISLGLPMTILTNAPRVHADTVLDFFDIKDLFESIHDIETNKLIGKPHEEAYMNAVKWGGHSLEDTLFFDDHAKYTKGYTAIGGKSVLVGDTGAGYGEPKTKDKAGSKTADGWDRSDPEAVAHIKSIYEIPELLDRLE
ncbi:MAG: HAD-IA family hydrolase [Treponemataceae bacterium]|nr:HAD-IA family hydrolase [Treponemataceae bacterium]